MYDAEGASDAAVVVALTAAHHCSAGTEAVANGMLDARNVGRAAASYLMECSNSTEALASVKRMFAAGQLRDADKFSIERMESRVTSSKR